MMARVALVSLSIVVACGNAAVQPDRTVEAAGIYSVGTTRFMVNDPARSRDLVAQAWFPSPIAASDTPVEMLEVEPIAGQYTQLLAAALPGCPSHTLPVALDAAAVAGTFPLVLISHCHACTRLSNATTAIRLASHGFVVVSVEHLGDTLWEDLAGTQADLDAEELEARTADVRAALDQVAAGGTPVSALADLGHVGVLGHSFGAVTAGRVAQLDSRVSAAAALCAPMENPLTPGVMIATLNVPLMFLVAEQDNSITELGNNLIRTNYAAATVAAYKIEVPDAGHWSVSDLDGLAPTFMPGCGAATRQTDGLPFTYLDPSVGRNIAAAYSVAFFKATLQGDAGAQSYLEAASPTFGVTLDIQHR